jgi:hypothetical protein
LQYDLRREESHGNPHPMARIHICIGRRGNCVTAHGARSTLGIGTGTVQRIASELG